MWHGGTGAALGGFKSAKNAKNAKNANPWRLALLAVLHPRESAVRILRNLPKLVETWSILCET